MSGSASSRSPYLTLRSDIATKVVLDLRDNLGIDMSMVDLLIVVLGIAPHVGSDGGSGQAVLSPERTLRSVGCRIGDRWDFMAHEIGHGLELEHSFGNDWVPVIGDHPGGYGHPHCIMSAMLYAASRAAAHTFRPSRATAGPNAPHSVHRSASFPWCVTAGCTSMSSPARRRANTGFAAAIMMAAPPPGLAPQAILVNGAQDATYAVEYRERVGWDLGQDRRLLHSQKAHRD